MNADAKHSSWKTQADILIPQPNSNGGIHVETLEIPIRDSLVMLNFLGNVGS